MCVREDLLVNHTELFGFFGFLPLRACDAVDVLLGENYLLHGPYLQLLIGLV
jgi:hypothetical protein